jgi:hypothetical protein
MPRHKRALYDTGIHVPLIIRFPERYRRLAPGGPGARVDRLVSFIDFAPTVLGLAGVKAPGYFQGGAFLGAAAAAPRPYVYAIRDRVDEVYELIRAVRDSRYKYLRNYMPHRPYMPPSDYCEPAATVQELRRLAREGKLEGPPALYMRPTKPAEELYDLVGDPWELRNLADSPEHQETLKRMRGALAAWMIETRDTGLLPEAEMFLRAGNSTILAMAGQHDRFPVERILAAAEHVGRPEATPEKLVPLLKDPDSAVRYWAAVGLMSPGTDARPAAEALLPALRDEAPNVRLAAAEALCRLDRVAEALPVLVKGLHHDDGRVRLQAAAVLAALGDKPRPALDEITKVHAQPGKDQFSTYTRWALGHVLRNLGIPTPLESK